MSRLLIPQLSFADLQLQVLEVLALILAAAVQRDDKHTELLTEVRLREAAPG